MSVPILSMLDILIIFDELMKAQTSVTFYHFIVNFFFFFNQPYPFNLNMFHRLSRAMTWLKMDYRCTSSLISLPKKNQQDMMNAECPTTAPAKSLTCCEMEKPIIMSPSGTSQDTVAESALRCMTDTLTGAGGRSRGKQANLLFHPLLYRN